MVDVHRGHALPHDPGIGMRFARIIYQCVEQPLVLKVPWVHFGREDVPYSAVHHDYAAPLELPKRLQESLLKLARFKEPCSGMVFLRALRPGLVLVVVEKLLHEGVAYSTELGYHLRFILGHPLVDCLPIRPALLGRRLQRACTILILQDDPVAATPPRIRPVMPVGHFASPYIHSVSVVLVAHFVCMQSTSCSGSSEKKPGPTCCPVS